MNKEQQRTINNIMKVNNPIKRYEMLLMLFNNVFIESLNGLNLSALVDIDTININNAEDVLSHIMKLKKDLISYNEELKKVNERIIKQNKINKILKALSQNEADDETNDENNDETNMLNIQEIENIIKRIDSLNIETVKRLITNDER